MAGARPMPEVPGVEHRYVDAGGLRMHVAEAGEGDPVLLLHGWPQHWYMWRGLIPRLAERYRVIAPDLRGLGWTEAPPDGYEKETLGLDVLALMDELELERVRLVGHDWGGMAGFLVSLRSPSRFEHHLAINAPHPWAQIGVRQLPRLLGLWYQVVMSSPVVGPRTVRLIASAARRSVRDMTAATWRPFVEQFDEPARARASQAIYRTFLTQEMPALARGRYEGERLAVPTKLLIGEDDPFISEETVAPIRDHADDFRVEEIPGHGHFVVDEAPDLVADRALRFFE